MILKASDSANVSLAGGLLLAAYLTHRCWTPPNPDLSESTNGLPKDEVAVSAEAIRLRSFVIVALWTMHILLTISYPETPVMLCPNPDNLARSIFTWSPYTAVVLTVILMAAPIRLLAFRQLGENFTFRLAKPKTLVTSGVYAYVQHPSYPTNWLVLMCNIMLLFRLDGVLGCAVPAQVARFGFWNVAVKVWPVLLAVFGGLGLCTIWTRVRDEEEMLREEFGTGWEEYNRKTARFVPGFF